MLVVLALVIALPLVFIPTGNEFGLKVATKILTYSILVVSLDLLVGYAGLVSLGHCAFFGIGAFATTLLINHSVTTDILLISLIAVILAAVVGFLFITLSIRTSNFNFLMITLAFCQMFYFTTISLRFLGGEDGMNLNGVASIVSYPLQSNVVIYYLVAMCLLAYVFLSLRLVNSNFGLAVRAFAHNPRKTGSLGYSDRRYISTLFVISAAGASLAGALYGIQVRYVSPDLFAWTKSAEILIMLILGGSGYIFGALLGAASILILEEILITESEHWQLYLGLILLTVVILSRDGLIGLFNRFRRRQHA